MAGSEGPSYISAHSADVILSDIRPIKLKVEALRCINVLLDEFLHSIISTASSLTTDKLRAGLLSALPTTLGKEALLEAEVELRAYWERTKDTEGSTEDDTDSFNLRWAFELLRLKCEAYSTLNESDEDPKAEEKLRDKMSHTGAQPPKPSLVAPAALYLTAIIEAMCEHILSNVGRVASRDSSRTAATVQDLFVALCEDDSIYGLFKTMNVYGQIEELSKPPKPRRSKSLSRSDKHSVSRTASPHHYDLSSSKDSPTPPPLSRLSSEVPGSVSSRSSFDKAKGMKKLLSNSRPSHDRDTDGHKRSDSILSEETKQTWAAYAQGFYDDSSLQEFDDLMRSGSTMKVSLTPDRLRTMEVYKQEKNRRPSTLLSGQQQEPDSPSTPPLPRAHGRRPSLRHHDSIVEDEEDLAAKQSSNNTPLQGRQATVASPPPPPISVASTSSNNRVRSFSVTTPKKPSSQSVVTSPPTSTPAPAMFAPSNRDRRSGGPKGISSDPFPQKTRRVQKNRESLDLDDVMAGSDDEDYEEEPSMMSTTTATTTVATPSKKIATPVKRTTKVSGSTRELMDFLNEGPPNVPKVSKAGRELMDFLAEGPPDQGFSPSASVQQFDNGKPPKGSGRLQRMMSKLSIRSDRPSSSQEDFSRSGFMGRTPTTPSRATLNGKNSSSNMSLLANKPIPPRPPIMSPPSPSSDDQMSSGTRSRQASMSGRRNNSAWEQNNTEPSISTSPSHAPNSYRAHQEKENGHVRPSSARSTASQGGRNGVLDHSNHAPSKSLNEFTSPRKPVKTMPAAIQIARKTPPLVTEDVTSSSSAITPSRTPPPPAAIPTPSPAFSSLSTDAAQELRTLIAKAGSADECRLLLDIFLVKSGASKEPAIYDIPYPSPSPSDTPEPQNTSEAALEKYLVELLLGGGEIVAEEIAAVEPAEEAPPRRPRKSVKRKPSAPATPSPVTALPVPPSLPPTALSEDIAQKHLAEVDTLM